MDVAAVSRAPEPRAAWTAKLAGLDGASLVGPEDDGAILAASPRRPLFVSFWATYCPPCLAEMPALEALHREGRGVVGVSMDMEHEDRARAAVTERGLSYPNLILTATSARAAAQAMDEGLPFGLLVGADDRVRALTRGEVSHDTLRALLEEDD